MKKEFFLIFLFLLSGCSSKEIIIDDISILCEQTGGRWNTCSSPCTGTDAEICAQVCVESCECLIENSFSCPEGYSCKHTSTGTVGVCE
jgi:hypothetical protein